MSLKFRFLLLFTASVLSLQAQDKLQYQIDVTKNTDTFYVDLNVPFKLGKANSVFQFPATAPGTYQTMNIGRLVSHFQAFNKNGKLLKTNFVAPNQYQIKKVKKLSNIRYQVAETFDTQLTEYPIYMMAGSSIEDDHTLINSHTMTGYFRGKQQNPIEMKVIGKPDWITGSPLKEVNGYLQAESFDHLVDSPILCGKLSLAETKVADTPIRIFTYSEKGKYDSKALLNHMQAMLQSAEKFLVKLPVDNYTFLYYFLQNPSGVTGAWEHSYSSEYVLAETNPTEQNMKQVTDIAAHEFFHVVTPLNIHSEIIEHFNFEKPTPSEHLWLYEGVTEWASHIQLLRGSVTDLKTYIQDALKQKVIVSEVYFNPDWSLVKIAEESFKGGEGAKQYGNIYYKGALAATYLDIRLLELSNGKFGLREVLLDLIKKYGKGNPFSEKTFFDDLAAMTFPEIKDFANDYIIGDKALPHEEYLSKIGLKYERKAKMNVEISEMENKKEQQEKLFQAWLVNLPR